MFLKRENYRIFHVFLCLAAYCTTTVTSAAAIFYMMIAMSMGDEVACSVKLSKDRHVPRDHVFE